MSEFRGALGSNTGDDFHELWATRQVIRLLLGEDGLEAVTVEGLSNKDEAGTAIDSWDGVDCAEYFGGGDATSADKIRLEQLKYSAASPEIPWTVARLVSGPRRGQSVIARLAKAWVAVKAVRPADVSLPVVLLISNQPIDRAVREGFARAAETPTVIPTRKPGTSARAELRLAYAAGLEADDFQAFAASMQFEGGAGSRFEQEEHVLRAISEWTDHDVRAVALTLRQFVRSRMRPEGKGLLITRETLLLHLGVSEGSALLPCASEINTISSPISRAPVRELARRLVAGLNHVCLHGSGGVGKTTALQEIEEALPSGSVMIKYDCYGGGRYLDPSALRHRPNDAFLQLTNEMAGRLRLPLLLSPHRGSDYPRLFMNRLTHAAAALKADHAAALIVIAIDAADNAVTAAASRSPPEAPFVHDFVRLEALPQNVRFVVTARTGRLDGLKLPAFYQRVEMGPFSREETGEHVLREWNAPEYWIDDFHHLSSGVPRVQAYAFKLDGIHPSTALDRLRPSGKSLDEVFREQFRGALKKSGDPTEVKKLCAGLIALPRPVPLGDLASVLDTQEACLVDICADLAPGIQIRTALVSFADEDFEHFVREEGQMVLSVVQQSAAQWLHSRAFVDCYAALNVAPALFAANRRAELLELVEQEPAPLAVMDPVLRREAELQRLRLAMKVCREAGDVARALRFVLIGAEGVKTETAITKLLLDNSDLASRFASETVGRLILSNGDYIDRHGPVLFHKLSADADRGDAISFREGERLVGAWMQARKNAYRDDERRRKKAWEIDSADISSEIGAVFKLRGSEAALDRLGGWSPRRLTLEVALQLVPRLIAEGSGDKLELLLASRRLLPRSALFLLVPLILAGREIDTDLLALGLAQLSRSRLHVRRFFDRHQESYSLHGQVLDYTLTACEILTAKGVAAEVVDPILDRFLSSELRRIDMRHEHHAGEFNLLFRAYALKEARAGRIPSADGIFEARPAIGDVRVRREQERHWEDHDRAIRELTNAVFGIYAATATALVVRPTESELERTLHEALARVQQDEWRASRRHGFIEVRRKAAKGLLVLFVLGENSSVVKRYAELVHGGWRRGGSVPDKDVISYLSLRRELHDSLLGDLAAGARETFRMRIGADDKSSALVSYARHLLPISSSDANAVFNDAIGAASELDQEVVAQIRLINRLISEGGPSCEDPLEAARLLSNLVADAAIRLSGWDHFPWDESMAAIARLDVCLALANAARWDDEGVSTLAATLPTVIKTALTANTMRPSQAAALALLTDGDQGLLSLVLDRTKRVDPLAAALIAEEVAWEVLVRDKHVASDSIAKIELNGEHRHWVDALLRQRAYLSSVGLEVATEEERLSGDCSSGEENPLDNFDWPQECLIDASKLGGTIETLRADGANRRCYLSANAILNSARAFVRPADRVAHLQAITDLDDPHDSRGVLEELLNAINGWSDSPAVQTWCRGKLPDAIVKRLPEFSHFIEYGEKTLSAALARTGLPDNRTCDLVLEGLERHVDEFGAERIFALAAFVGGRLDAADAAGLVTWYIGRLAGRIPEADRDQSCSEASLAKTLEEAVARFLFAYLGDCDLRLRWRAAHAVRRLARLDDHATLNALANEYRRQEEPAFRGRDMPFYWLAARLWSVIAWDRIAGERPDMVAAFGLGLYLIATDKAFPHLLVRGFARAACEKMVAAGVLSLSREEVTCLMAVNESPLARAPRAEPSMRSFDRRDERRRFQFDVMDTIPYWYEHILNCFAHLAGSRFLETAEHWIIDVWGHGGDIRAFYKEPRRSRFDGWDWNLSSNRHGSIPVVERLNTHLEWHAMWCAAGELLETEPLLQRDDRDWDSWRELSERTKRDMLSEPPLWLSDLLGPCPLAVRYWRQDSRPLEVWAFDVQEAFHRIEVFPSDAPEYIVVSSSTEVRSNDRVETTHVSSALSGAETGAALLRALQTMDDASDYKLPDQDDDSFEIDNGPYRLVGWLSRSRDGEGIDDKDPFRGYASHIESSPGRMVRAACSLTRDASGRPIWSSGGPTVPMFVYEAWGKRDNDDERYNPKLVVGGYRLLAHKEALRKFLFHQGMDLIVEVEVTRRERDRGRYFSEEKKVAEGRFDRLYRLAWGGALDIAEGRIGTWANDSPPT